MLSKKNLFLLLSIAMTLVLVAACGGAAQPAAPAEEQPAEAEAPATEEAPAEAEAPAEEEAPAEAEAPAEEAAE